MIFVVLNLIRRAIFGHGGHQIKNFLLPSYLFNTALSFRLEWKIVLQANYKKPAQLELDQLQLQITKKNTNFLCFNRPKNSRIVLCLSSWQDDDCCRCGSVEWFQISTRTKIEDIIEDIEESKTFSGGFHPHVAKWILSTIFQRTGNYPIVGENLLKKTIIYGNTTAPLL